MVLVDLLFSLAQMGLEHATKAQLPVQIVQAFQSAVDQILIHKADLLTKANFEKNRG